MVKTLILSIVLCIVMLGILWWMVHTAFKVQREMDYDLKEEERVTRESLEAARKLDESIKRAEKEKV